MLERITGLDETIDHIYCQTNTHFWLCYSFLALLLISGFATHFWLCYSFLAWMKQSIQDRVYRIEYTG